MLAAISFSFSSRPTTYSVLILPNISAKGLFLEPRDIPTSFGIIEAGLTLKRLEKSYNVFSLPTFSNSIYLFVPNGSKSLQNTFLISSSKKNTATIEFTSGTLSLKTEGLQSKVFVLRTSLCKPTL